MDLQHLTYLFTAFQGRVPRQAFWIGIVVLILLSIGLVTVISQVMGVTLQQHLNQSPEAGRVNMIASILLLFPSLAVFIKRLHDRDRTGWWMALVYGLSALGYVLEMAGLAGTVEAPSQLYIVLGLVTLVANLWLLVECGFLKGTPGENRFGPDPLGGTPDASYD